MKRLHIVGKSPDNRRLYFAQAKGAKVGRFEVPISSKLLKLVREAEGSRGGKAKRTSRKAASDPSASPSQAAPEEGRGAEERSRLEAGKPRREDAGRRPAEDPPRAEGDPKAEPEDETSIRVVRRGGGSDDTRRGSGSPPRAVEAGSDIPLGPRRGRTSDEQPDARAPVTKEPGEEDPGDRRLKRPRIAGREESPAVETQAPPQAPSAPEHLLVRPRTERPEIPARSKLSPAEIQSLIRAGRTVRTVAQMAGTPPAWVRYLAEPVQQERMAIVANALGQRQTRARLGASAEPLGRSVAMNLRSRGVSGADRVVDERFTAVRSNGREWRLRLSFEHRGRRTSAVWSYDPQRREVTPLNTLATQLGWRRPRVSRVDDGEVRAAPRRRTTKSSRGGSSSRSGRAAAARKTSRSRARSSPTISARRRSSS